jgi:hypothetical protein
MAATSVKPSSSRSAANLRSAAAVAADAGLSTGVKWAGLRVCSLASVRMWLLEVVRSSLIARFSISLGWARLSGDGLDAAVCH